MAALAVTVGVAEASAQLEMIDQGRSVRSAASFDVLGETDAIDQTNESVDLGVFADSLNVRVGRSGFNARAQSTTASGLCGRSCFAVGSTSLLVDRSPSAGFLSAAATVDLAFTFTLDRARRGSIIADTNLLASDTGMASATMTLQRLAPTAETIVELAGQEDEFLFGDMEAGTYRFSAVLSDSFTSTGGSPGIIPATTTMRFELDFSACPCDVNEDDEATIGDLLLFLAPWFVNEADADFDDDGSVGIQDLLQFLDCWLALRADGCVCLAS